MYHSCGAGIVFVTHVYEMSSDVITSETPCKSLEHVHFVVDYLAWTPSAKAGEPTRTEATTISTKICTLDGSSHQTRTKYAFYRALNTKVTVETLPSTFRWLLVTWYLSASRAWWKIGKGRYGNWISRVHYHRRLVFYLKALKFICFTYLLHIFRVWSPFYYQQFGHIIIESPLSFMWVCSFL